MEKIFKDIFLAQYPFTTSERELDHFHPILNIGVASRVSGRLKS